MLLQNLILPCCCHNSCKRKFVIDCKKYGAQSYITKGDVDKLLRDKEEEGAAMGFIVTTCRQISLERLQYLKENNCGFLYVGDVLKKRLYLLTLL